MSDWNQLRTAGESLVKEGNLLAAKAVWRDALEEAEAFGEQDPRYLMSLEYLAEVLFNMGKPEAALPHCLKLLSLYEAKLGPDHVDVGILASNVASICHGLDRLNEAEPMYKKAIAIQRNTHGSHHPQVMALVNGYATLLVSLDREGEAETLKSENESVASGRWNRSGFYRAVLPAASITVVEPVASMPVESSATAGEPSRPLTEDAQNSASPSLAAPSSAAPIVAAQSSTAQSTEIPDAVEASQTNESGAPPSLTAPERRPEDQSEAGENGSAVHADGASDFTAANSVSIAASGASPANSMAEAPVPEVNDEWPLLFWAGQQALAQGDDHLAEGYFRQALDLVQSTKVWDERLPQTLECLLESLWRQGKHAQAEPLCRLNLEIYERILGPGHFEVGVMVHNLAMLCHAIGKHEEAESLYRRALEIRTRAQGPQHPDVSALMTNYANLLYALKRNQEAENLKHHIKNPTSGRWSSCGQFKAIPSEATVISSTKLKKVGEDPNLYDRLVDAVTKSKEYGLL